MLSLKLVRSLVLGDTINTNTFLSTQSHQHHNNDEDEDEDEDEYDDEEEHQEEYHSTSDPNHAHQKGTKKRTTPLLIFLPTNEIIKDTYKLCTIARDMGMNLQPSPSLSHIIFSWPQPSPSPLSTSTSTSALWSSTSTSTWSISGDFVPLPFPFFTFASTTHLQCFVGLSKGMFKLVFCKFKKHKNVSESMSMSMSMNNWNCSSLSLFSRLNGDRIDSMDGFVKVLVGLGWTMFKSNNNASLVCRNFGSSGPISVYLFRKVESNRAEFAQLSRDSNSCRNGGFRIRELRLPTLDFRNAPLRILQYILLMTDNIFYLA